MAGISPPFSDDNALTFLINAEAAEKSEESIKLKLSHPYKKYLAPKVREFNKRAELIEAANGIPQALIALIVSQSRSSFIRRANAATEQADRLGKEAADLSPQGEKVQKDNPNSFKK
jgi:hypothetical protein